MVDLGGSCEPGFEPVQEMLVANIESGVELGASLYVTVDGDPVVDLWGGWRDRQKTDPWTEDTIVNVFSATKCVTSLAVLTLVDRGEIDVDAPVAQYWPEFGQNGKEGVLVRHILSHTSGVSAWEQPFRPSDAFDWAASTSKLARQALWFEPGSVGCYHASNFGHLNGEVVRRVTGKTLGTYIAEEIAGPLDADFLLGVPDGDFGRIAPVCLPPGREPTSTGPPPAPTDPDILDSLRYKTMLGGFSYPREGVPEMSVLANTAEWRRAEIGASNGHCNARGLGRILSSITNGGVSRGVRLMSPETIDLIFREQFAGVDLYVNLPLRWGMGYALSGPEDAESEPWRMKFVPPGSKLCYWAGWGGSFATMDVERKITITYAMNQLHLGPDPSKRANEIPPAYTDLIYACAERTSTNDLWRR
jgi:CubicO group peptidase (beta-lactamase class C family)